MTISVDISADISAEQARQHEIHPVRPASHLHWLAVSTEELLESLEEIRQVEDGLLRTILELGRRTQDITESLDCRDREDAVVLLRQELVQAAACLYSWIEWIDERHRIPGLVTRSDTIRGHDIREAVLRDEARKTAQKREQMALVMPTCVGDEGLVALLDTKIVDVDEFAPRAVNAFIWSGIVTIRELVQLSKREVLNLKGMGCVTANEIEEILRKVGLSFAEGDVICSTSGRLLASRETRWVWAVERE